MGVRKSQPAPTATAIRYASGLAPRSLATAAAIGATISTVAALLRNGVTAMPTTRSSSNTAAAAASATCVGAQRQRAFRQRQHFQIGERLGDFALARLEDHDIARLQPGGAQFLCQVPAFAADRQQAEAIALMDARLRRGAAHQQALAAIEDEIADAEARAKDETAAWRAEDKRLKAALAAARKP